MYLGLFALVVAVGWRVTHGRDDTLPVVHKPRPGKARPGEARPDQTPRPAVGSAALGSDTPNDRDPRS
jgi:hypothetical protein